MDKLQEFIQWKTETTEPAVIERQVIRLESQSLSITSPFGGFVWNRPTSVIVGQHGLTKRVPITDVTRNALWTLTGIGLIAPAFIWVISKIRSNKFRRNKFRRNRS